jgi:inner membrane protein
MDNVTHTLTGLMLARAGLGSGTRSSSVMLMLAASAPDIDAVSWFGGTLTYLEYHRHITHSLAAAPVVAALPMLIVAAFARGVLSWRSYFGCLLVVLSHLLLDWTNVYGIRLLLPFSSDWLRLDITDVVDPWILGILILALAAPGLVKLVNDEIGSRRSAAPKRAWAVFALLAFAAYDGGRWVAHVRAEAILGSHLYGGALPLRIAALPVRINPLRWRGVIEGEGFVYEVPVDLSRDFDPGAGRVDYPAEASPAIDAARKTRPFEVFGRFDQLPFWRVRPLVDVTRVELIDMRFGPLAEPGFVAYALVEPDGVVRESRFAFGLPRQP